MDCSICYEDLTNNEVKIGCGHMFHNKCLIQWIITKNTCPICRYNINHKTEEEEEELADEEDDEIKLILNNENISNLTIETIVYNFALNSINEENACNWTDTEDDIAYTLGHVQKKIEGELKRIHICVQKYNDIYFLTCIDIENLVSQKHIKQKNKNKNKNNYKNNKRIRNQNYFRKRPKVY
jgi:hypothetical protein